MPISPQVTYSALLGRVLQHCREARGLNQAQVAAALGILQPSYSRIEQGGTAITVLQLRAISNTLGQDAATILANVENWSRKLQQQGVRVVDDQKEVPKAALLVGLGVLAGLIAIGSAAAGG